HPCTQIEGGTEIGMQIIADFAHMFKSGQFTDLVGTPSHLYSIGFSNSTWALFPLINDPLGENLFDLSLIVTTGWPVPIPIDFRSPVEDAPPHVPSAAAGKVMVLLTEGDIALWGPTLRDDATNPLYRAYEVAGAAHIPPPFSSAVNWTPVLRALFVAGDQWVTEGVEPPASIAMESANADVVDPVYGRVTGIARDEDLNALGGIRLPDLALGRGQFIAVDTETLVLLGTFIEQKCALMADGSPRFPTHEAYVDAFTAHTEALVAERLLLPSDAERLIEEAMSSDVGVQENCATSASE
ncbi:MAG: hypothetical protein KDE31_38325, partial [Caldilineaceae bacterium]|nr:hypothetical protein [Caldilineaceae bacterium]